MNPRTRTDDRPGFIRRHRGLVLAVLALAGVLVVAVGGFAIALNHSLGDIKRVPLTIEEYRRPPPAPGESLNILLLGADAGSERDPSGNSILEDAASGSWPRGKYRSDATMLVHLDADRSAAWIVSIPRDSYVPVHDQTGRSRGSTKINAALSLYGPSGAISTVEHLTDLRVDHLAMVDWDGFEDITDALGGVRITTDEGVRDFDGKQALAYVRDRFTVEGGDFGRVRRQQNFLRAMMLEILDRGTLTNPLKLRSTVASIARNMAVDESWSNGEIRSLAFSLRGLRPADVTFMTVPTRGTATDPVAGSIVRVDDTLSDRLFAAMRDDTVGGFVADYPELVLGSAQDVD